MVSSLFLQLLYNYCIDINIYLEDSTGNTKSNWDKIKNQESGRWASDGFLSNAQLLIPKRIRYAKTCFMMARP